MAAISRVGIRHSLAVLGHKDSLGHGVLEVVVAVKMGTPSEDWHHSN